jgi:pimeloyl-ACP methyl ester carboxylesterase
VGLIRLDASPDRPQPPAASDARDLGRFTSSEAERQYVAACDEVLALWPIPVTNLTVSTPFADTHVIASGPEAGPPLVLLHATGMSGTGWFPNAGALGRMHRTFAVDIANEPGANPPNEPAARPRRLRHVALGGAGRTGRLARHSDRVVARGLAFHQPCTPCA